MEKLIPKTLCLFFALCVPLSEANAKPRLAAPTQFRLCGPQRNTLSESCLMKLPLSGERTAHLLQLRDVFTTNMQFFRWSVGSYSSMGVVYSCVSPKSQRAIYSPRSTALLLVIMSVSPLAHSLVDLIFLVGGLHLN